MTDASDVTHRAMPLTLASMIAAARGGAHEVAPDDARAALDAGAMHLVIDVREPQEFRDAHIPDAVCIPRGLLELRADPNSPAADQALTGGRSKRILLYCTKGPGARSLLAAQTLTSMGYQHVEVLAGGLNAWDESGLPVTREQAPAAL
jgi:rhodanese-related sulfurtransferase